jgi:hypothetical protein
MTMSTTEVGSREYFRVLCRSWTLNEIIRACHLACANKQDRDAYEAARKGRSLPELIEISSGVLHAMLRGQAIKPAVSQVVTTKRVSSIPPPGAVTTPAIKKDSRPPPVELSLPRPSLPESGRYSMILRYRGELNERAMMIDSSAV